MKIRELFFSLCSDLRYFKKSLLFIFAIFILAFSYLLERVYLASLKLEISKRYEILSAEKIKTARLEYEFNALTTSDKLDLLSQKLNLVEPIPSNIYTLKEPLAREKIMGQYTFFRRVSNLLGFNLSFNDKAMK